MRFSFKRTIYFTSFSESTESDIFAHFCNRISLFLTLRHFNVKRLHRQFCFAQVAASRSLHIRSDAGTTTLRNESGGVPRAKCDINVQNILKCSYEFSKDYTIIFSEVIIFVLQDLSF